MLVIRSLSPVVTLSQGIVVPSKVPSVVECEMHGIYFRVVSTVSPSSSPMLRSISSHLNALEIGFCFDLNKKEDVTRLKYLVLRKKM